MSIAVIGSESSYEFRWRRWALLRDTAALSPDGEPAVFPLFNSIGDVLLLDCLRIHAEGLQQEIAAIQAALVGRGLDTLMISPATAAVLYMGTKLPAPRVLSERELAQVAPAGTSSDLADYFAAMCSALLAVCNSPQADGRVEVIDG